MIMIQPRECQNLMKWPRWMLHPLDTSSHQDQLTHSSIN